MSTVLIWLDANAHITTSFRDKLLAYRSVKIFTESENCIEYIKSHLSTHAFLVASGALAEHVVPQINDYANIEQIFVFCASIESHTHWAVDYTEKLMMFDHPDDLLQRLWSEMEQHFRKQAEECLQQAEEMKERAKQYKKPACG